VTATTSSDEPLVFGRLSAYSPKLVESLSEKSLGSLWNVGFGSVTLQEQALYAPFQQFTNSSVREFDCFQIVS